MGLGWIILAVVIVIYLRVKLWSGDEQSRIEQGKLWKSSHNTESALSVLRKEFDIVKQQAETFKLRLQFQDQQKEQKVIDLLQEAKDLGFQLRHVGYEEFNGGSSMILSIGAEAAAWSYSITAGGFLKVDKPKRKKKEKPAPPALKHLGTSYGSMTFDKARAALDQEKAKLFTECRKKGDCQ